MILREAKVHILFTSRLAALRMDAARHCLFEHPLGAASWHRPAGQPAGQLAGRLASRPLDVVLSCVFLTHAWRAADWPPLGPSFLNQLFS